MGSVEFDGKDLEEAIAKAAAALSLPPEQVKFSVISMGTKGFLGLGRRQARIAVNPDDPALDIDDEAPSQRRKATVSLKENTEPQSRDRKMAPARLPGEREAVLGANEKKSADEARLDDRVSELKKAEEATLAKKETKDHRPAKKEKSHERAAALAGELPPLDWSHLTPLPTKPRPGETVIDGPVDQSGELALEVTREMIARMGFMAEISTVRIGARIVVSLDSPDNALLIGARGATLESMQLLVSKIVNRRLGEDSEAAPLQVVLDVADYRSRRRESLLETLKNIGEQARRTRKPQTMPGLNAEERRLVQLALKPFKDLHVQLSDGRDALTISSHPSRPRRRMSGGPPPRKDVSEKSPDS